jgi:hypothetical protein
MRQIEQLAQEWRRHEERRIRMTRLFAEWNWQLADEERRRSAASAGGMAESAT